MINLILWAVAITAIVVMRYQNKKLRGMLNAVSYELQKQNSEVSLLGGRLNTLKVELLAMEQSQEARVMARVTREPFIKVREPESKKKSSDAYSGSSRGRDIYWDEGFSSSRDSSRYDSPSCSSSSSGYSGSSSSSSNDSSCSSSSSGGGD